MLLIHIYLTNMSLVIGYAFLDLLSWESYSEGGFRWPPFKGHGSLLI